MNQKYNLCFGYGFQLTFEMKTKRIFEKCLIIGLHRHNNRTVFAVRSSVMQRVCLSVWVCFHS